MNEIWSQSAWVQIPAVLCTCYETKGNFLNFLLSLSFPIYKLGTIIALIWDPDMSDYVRWTGDIVPRSLRGEKKNLTMKEGVRWTRFSHWLGHPEDELIINLDSSSDLVSLTTPLQPVELWLVGMGGRPYGKCTSVFSKHYETLGIPLTKSGIVKREGWPSPSSATRHWVALCLKDSAAPVIKELD